MCHVQFSGLWLGSLIRSWSPIPCLLISIACARVYCIRLNTTLVGFLFHSIYKFRPITELMFNGGQRSSTDMIDSDGVQGKSLTIAQVSGHCVKYKIFKISNEVNG